MCILFIYVCANPGVDKYKLILASNRDEYFHRPTNISQFWSGNNSNIVGGQDMESGKEGGTWLAMNKSGKLGILLNILTSDPIDPNKLGRGFLVNDFLNSTELDGYNYCEKLHKNADSYNPFNLVTIDIKKKNGVCMTYYSSKSLDGNPLQLNCDKNIYAFGNSVFERPFMKVTDGHDRMTKIVKLYNNTKQKQCLLDELLGILKCKKQFSDPQMQLQAPKLPSDHLTQMSSKFCYVPSDNYGSRTHTVILVDNRDRVEFHEWTLDVPTQVNSTLERQECTNWIHSEFQFSLE